MPNMFTAGFVKTKSSRIAELESRVAELEAWCRNAYPLIAAVGFDPQEHRRKETARLIESMPVKP